MIPTNYTINQQYHSNLLFGIVYEWEVDGRPVKRLSPQLEESAARAYQRAQFHQENTRKDGRDVSFYIVPVAIFDPVTCPQGAFPDLPAEAANVTRAADQLHNRS